MTYKRLYKYEISLFINPVSLICAGIVLTVIFVIRILTQFEYDPSIFFALRGIEIHVGQGVNMWRIVEWILYQIPVIFAVTYAANRIFSEMGVYALYRYVTCYKFILVNFLTSITIVFLYSVCLFIILSIPDPRIVWNPISFGNKLIPYTVILLFPTNLAMIATMIMFLYLVTRNEKTVIFIYFVGIISSVVNGDQGLSLDLFMPLNWGMIAYCAPYSHTGFNIFAIIAIQTFIMVGLIILSYWYIRKKGFILKQGINK